MVPDRRTWASWTSLAPRTAEGGLDLRRMVDVVDAFSVKLWWKVRTGDSL